MKIAAISSLSLLLLGLLAPSAQAKRARCADFTTQQEAQDFFQKNNATYLDRDKDGVACESLPGGNATPRTTTQPRTTATGQTVVISTGDGDTLRVRENGKSITVRLGCIDSPERSQNPWGGAAASRLKALLPAGQVVQLRKLDTDRYGRSVAEVLVGGRSINLQMVTEGQALVYRQYLGNCDRTAYLNAEAAAKAQGAGVWNPQNPLKTMPWNYRRSSR